MKVTFYVNAMALIEGKSSKILCDPWLTFDECSSSGFYNFPRTRTTRKELVSIAPDYIYISHTHPDHLDPVTLENFAKDTPILVAPFAMNFTERTLRGLGFSDVRIVPMGEGLSLNGDDWVWIEPSAVVPDEDSIALFRIDGNHIINVNDNSFSEEQCLSLKKKSGGIDVGLIPSALHGPWPMFFQNYSEKEKLELATERKQKLKEIFRSYVDALEPNYVIPFGGGIVAGGEHAKCYKYSGASPRTEVVKYAMDNCANKFTPVLLSESCSYDFNTGVKSGKYIESTYETEKAYMQRLSQIPSKYSRGGDFYIAPSERKDLTFLLSKARETQKRWQDRKKIVSDSVWFFDVGEDNLYRLSLANTDVTRVPESEIEDEKYELFRMPYEVLLGMLIRHNHWTNVNTQHCWFNRKGDQMDTDVYELINYFQI